MMPTSVRAAVTVASPRPATELAAISSPRSGAVAAGSSTGSAVPKIWLRALTTTSLAAKPEIRAPVDSQSPKPVGTKTGLMASATWPYSCPAARCPKGG